MQIKIKANFTLLFVLCVLCSCNSATKMHYSDKLNVVHNRIKLDVVHISQQDDYSCATTSVAMAISYFEKKTLDKNAVWTISGSSISKVKDYGNDMDGLKRIAEHYGYKSEFREGLSFHDIEGFLSDGIPIVINILQHVVKNTTHAVLVVGYDRNEQIFLINDPAQSVFGKSISYKKLSDLWSGYLSSPSKMTYRSGFIIYPKSDQFLHK